jgi:RNA recognition motif-containing protein
MVSKDQNNSSDSNSIDEDEVNSAEDFLRTLWVLSFQELDRDIAEISTEIRFTEEQMKTDFARYSPENTSRVSEKVSVLRKKAEIMKIELEKRKSDGEQ